jgi:hypothetical protein
MTNYGIAQPKYVDGPIGRGLAKDRTAEAVLEAIKNDPRIQAAVQDAIDNPPQHHAGAIGGTTPVAHIREALITALQAF